MVNTAASSHYDTLGIPSTATAEEVRKAYRTLALQWHPDKQSDSDDVAFKQILEAYTILSNEKSREEYDLTLQKKQERRTFSYHSHEPPSRYESSSSVRFTRHPLRQFRDPFTHFATLQNRLFSDFFNRAAFSDFFAPLRSDPFPLSKKVICDLTDDGEGFRYLLQVRWSDGSITHHPLQ